VWIRKVQPVRILNGLLIAIGGIWIAWTMWRETGRVQQMAVSEPSREGISS
jgi:hypothetical protein